MKQQVSISQLKQLLESEKGEELLSEFIAENGLEDKGAVDVEEIILAWEVSEGICMTIPGFEEIGVHKLSAVCLTFLAELKKAKDGQ